MTATATKQLLESQWHYLSVEKVTRHLESDLELGLTANEAVQRQQHFGANEIKSKPGKSPWLRFIGQFNQPLLYILLIAGAIKALLGSWANAWVIWGVTVINAIIGYVQEAKAESAIAALASSVTTEANIIRNGQKVRISSTELIPGDIVLLASGDIVPGDLRLIKVRNLQVNESALTGESIAVEKDTQPPFEPKSKREMEYPPRNPKEPLLSGNLLKRILIISAFNWIVIFGVFKWVQQSTGNIDLARTMAIQSLVAGRIFYLLSISQLSNDFIGKLQRKAVNIDTAPAIVIGIIGAVILQVLFSQLSFMNNLFYTTTLNLNQWFIYLVVGLPMIPTSALVNRLYPHN
ncbi:HAD-IC family P-type ATPase [Aliterella atlantica]|uniref:Cation-transporting P-type ATPase N-terminal domain-containing protein n=1 Tax=Aliterella atlantica CENA595 TaxID=1618023 RepID=A0A0D8ZLV0_9CYAN|nr:HAD-IC family P-type ATPase [Aliterella atlantica]KJH69700.1 hypothetical protein UH38_22535 [Aliterella atlantica CENA595]